MRTRGLIAVLLALTVTTLTGCAQSVDPIERLGKKAAQRVRPLSHDPGAPGSPGGPGGPGRSGHSGHSGQESLPPVVDRVPTHDKVVFLTYDDGAERDPRFVDLVRELRLPVSVFLTDSVVGPGYGHFARLRAVGATLENHTLDHAALRGLPYAGQRAEICGQQEKLHARFGLRPRLFRPPYGTYDTTTLRAAADCGIAAVVLWRAAMGPAGLTYTHGAPGLGPGDIVALDPDESTGPSLRERTTRLLRVVRERGLTVGRLEDYLEDYLEGYLEGYLQGTAKPENRPTPRRD